MFDETEDLFSGFMPMIKQINITKEIAMINTDGDLISGHTITIKTGDGSDHVFSISNADLMRLCFLTMKIIQSE
jgi:hypothetical protein